MVNIWLRVRPDDIKEITQTMERDGLTERVVATIEGHRDPFTGKLRPDQFTSVIREVANRLEVSWPAVALRIPAEMMPSRERMADHYRQRRYPPCLGCAEPQCAECRRSQIEMGQATSEELLDMLELATLTGLDYADVRREQQRRTALRADT